MFQFIWSRLKIFRGTFIIIAVCSILISTTDLPCTIFSRRIEILSAYRLVAEILRRVQNARGEFLFQTDMVYLAKRIDADARGLMSFAVNSAVEVCINFVMLGLAIFLLAGIGAKWLALFFFVLIFHVVL